MAKTNEKLTANHPKISIAKEKTSKGVEVVGQSVRYGNGSPRFPYSGDRPDARMVGMMAPAMEISNPVVELF
jgi:hypothetical protein